MKNGIEKTLAAFPPEVLVDGKTARLIRRRETDEDMLAAERELSG